MGACSSSKEVLRKMIRKEIGLWTNACQSRRDCVPKHDTLRNCRAPIVRQFVIPNVHSVIGVVPPNRPLTESDEMRVSAGVDWRLSLSLDHATHCTIPRRF